MFTRPLGFAVTETLLIFAFAIETSERPMDVESNDVFRLSPYALRKKYQKEDRKHARETKPTMYGYFVLHTENKKTTDKNSQLLKI